MELDKYAVWVKIGCLLNHGEFTTISSFSEDIPYIFPPDELDPQYTSEFT